MTHPLVFHACVRDENSSLRLELVHVSELKYIYRSLVRRENITELFEPPVSEVLGLVTHDDQRLITIGRDLRV